MLRVPVLIALACAAAASVAHAQMLPPDFVRPSIALPHGSVRSPAAQKPQAGAARPSRATRSGVCADLFAPIARDVARLASRQTAMTLAFGGAAAVAVHPDDRPITRSFAGSEPVDEALDAGSILGSAPIQLGAAFGAYVVGRATGHAAAAHVGADLVQAQAVSGALTQGLKLAVRRPRPDGRGSSFPSGHTSAAFATATVLERHFGWRIGVPAYAAAAYVGGSRLAENQHFMSDVLFGAAVGIVAARAVTIGHGRHPVGVAPVAVPGGAAVLVVGLGSQ